MKFAQIGKYRQKQQIKVLPTKSKKLDVLWKRQQLRRLNLRKVCLESAQSNQQIWKRKHKTCMEQVKVQDARMQQSVVFSLFAK